MIYKIVTDPMDNAKNVKYQIEALKDKIFDDIYVQVTLDEIETMALVFDIIKHDTQIDINEYDLRIDSVSEYSNFLDIDDDEDLTDKEKEYIKKHLVKQYGQNVLEDVINPVIKQKLHREHYEIQYSDYNIDFAMTIDIPLEDFNKKSLIHQHLLAIE